MNNEEMKKLRFYKNQFSKLLLRTKMDDNKSLKKIFRRNKIINEEIDEEINNRLKGVIENFVTILIRGEQGTFKSSVGINKCEELDLTGFKAKNIAFLYEDFKQKIHRSKPKQAFQLDEEVFVHGTGSQRIVEEIQNMIETLRKRQNSMVIISPSDKYFPEEVFTFVMETMDYCLLGTCEKNNKLHEVRDCEHYYQQDHEMKKAYIRLGVRKRDRYVGFYIQEIDWESKTWDDYNKEKGKFLELSRKQDYKKLDYEKEAKKILERKDIKLYKSQKKLMLLIEETNPNLTIQEKQNLLAKIMVIKEKNKEEEKPEGK